MNNGENRSADMDWEQALFRDFKSFEEQDCQENVDELFDSSQLENICDNAPPIEYPDRIVAGELLPHVLSEQYEPSEEITDTDKIKQRREHIRQVIRTHGMGYMSPCDVLEYLLYLCIPKRDTRPIARRLLREFGTFSGVLHAREEDIIKAGEISSTAALFLCSLPMLFKFNFADMWREKEVFPDSLCVGQYMCDFFAVDNVEMLGVVSLDSSCKLIKVDVLNSGLSNSVSVSARDVVQIALQNGAAAIVLAHNHPGGCMSASEEDIRITREILAKMSTISIKVLDHLIVSNGRFASMKYRGLLLWESTYDLTLRVNNDINGDWKFG